MRYFRVILALVLLTAGVLRWTPDNGSRRTLRLTGRTTARARAELAELDADSGSFQVGRFADPLRIRLLGLGGPSADLIEWAARHGITLPAKDDTTRFTIGDAVVGDSGHRIADTESPVAAPMGADTGEPDRFIRADDEAPFPHRPAPLGDRFACRAPPTA